MVRMSDQAERRRELVENSLACHARIRKSFEIIAVCLIQGNKPALETARKEVEFATRMVKKSQSELSELWNEGLWK